MSTTAGTTESSLLEQWSDLLALVHLWLVSPRDRAHLGAVCKAWRAVASRLPTLPPVPLLLLSPRCPRRGTKRLCGPDDSWVVHLPDKAENKWFAGSHDGGWVAAVDYGKVMIVNLFSGEEVMAWPIHSRNLDHMEPTNPRKIIFSEAPNSSSCILAAITYGRSSIALCKAGHHDSGWTVEYLNGKSIMAIHHQWVPNHEYFFKVFTLVDTDDYDEAYMYKWEEVMSFGDHALLFGSNWSKAVHVMADGHHGLMRNHIYYSIRTLSPTNDDTVYSVTVNNNIHMYCKKDKCR